MTINLTEKEQAILRNIAVKQQQVQVELNNVVSVMFAARDLDQVKGAIISEDLTTITFDSEVEQAEVIEE